MWSEAAAGRRISAMLAYGVFGAVFSARPPDFCFVLNPAGIVHV